MPVFFVLKESAAFTDCVLVDFLDFVLDVVDFDFLFVIRFEDVLAEEGYVVSGDSHDVIELFLV